MRLGHMVLLSALVGVAACGPKAESEKAAPEPATALTPAQAPKLRPGLWTMAVEGMPGAGAGTGLCVDETLQEQMSLLAGPASADCTENSITPRAGGGYTIRSVCPTGDGRTRTSQGTITGDFETAYRAELTVTASGEASDTRNGAMTMVATYTYAGPCPAGMRPGDFDVGGGVRMNLTDLAEQSKAAEAAAGRP